MSSTKGLKAWNFRVLELERGVLDNWTSAGKVYKGPQLLDYCSQPKLIDLAISNDGLK